MIMEELFIKTKDEETKDKLVKCGFELIDFSGGVYTFLNSSTMNFEKHDDEKIVYSNILSV